MSGEFCEVDLSDHVIPSASNESPDEDIPRQRKSYPAALKLTSTSPLSLDATTEEVTSPAPLASPPISAISTSSSSSPRHLMRSAGSTDLTKQTFQFPLSRHDSIIDSLLSTIYERDGSTYGLSSSQDSDTMTTGDFTDRSLNMRRLSGDSMTNTEATVFSRTNLANKSLDDLRQLCNQLQQMIVQANAMLVKNLRHRDKNLSKLQRNCDIITAILQAASLKRREDTTMRFSLTPCPGEKGFQQWKDAISVAIRMPGGLPPSIRQKLWISLASNYIREIRLDWPKTCRFAFNNCSNPDDDQLGIQIVKDLHRTGCSWSSNESDRATLKRVLLAFARYNKSIGYCQGLNILTAVILDVVDMNEEHAFMILIYLIDSILPNFFANNLRALAVDMAVFREWLKFHHPKLHDHLQKLQSSSQDASGTVYEPPLLNVFTIQWFLTLFATCLPRSAALRVWDALMIEGNEVLFRTGLVLWSKLAISVLKVPTADQFYSAMAHLSLQLLDEKIIDADNLIRDIYNFGSFPTPLLSELRQKFSFNITPFQQLSTAATNPESDSSKRTAVRTNSDEMKGQEKKRKKAKNGPGTDDDTAPMADEDIANFMSCFAILSSPSRNNRLEYHPTETSPNNNPAALSRLTPGAYSNLPTTHKTHSIEDSLSLDISQLRQQYRKLKERNKQVQVIIQTASNEQRQRTRAPSTNTTTAPESFRRSTITSLEFSAPKLPSTVCSIAEGPLINHLLIKTPDPKRNQLKRTVSMKSPSASSVPIVERISKPIRSMVLEPIPPEKAVRSKQEEAEEAAELQQEIDQLLTSLNLEKPPLTPSSSSASTNIEQAEESTGQIETVVRTLYDIQRPQLTVNESQRITTKAATTMDKKEPSNLIDRLLTTGSVEIPKYSSFNPFPSRSFNENVAVNGYKLGLYAPDPSTR